MKIPIRSLLVALGLFFTISCTDQEAQQERDQAFEDYRNYVTQVEEDAASGYSETELRAMQQSAEDDSRWEKESAEVMQGYDERKRKVVQNIDMYSEAEQQEFRELEERYNKAYQKQKENYQEVSRRYKLRKELLELDVSSDDMSSITAEDLPGAYVRFVQNLEPRAAELEGRDWELVEGWWVALNNRKRALEQELSADAKATIEKASERYKNIRQENEIS